MPIDVSTIQEIFRTKPEYILYRVYTVKPLNLEPVDVRSTGIHIQITMIS